MQRGSQPRMRVKVARLPGLGKLSSSGRYDSTGLHTGIARWFIARLVHWFSASVPTTCARNESGADVNAQGVSFCDTLVSTLPSGSRPGGRGATYEVNCRSGGRPPGDRIVRSPAGSKPVAPAREGYTSCEVGPCTSGSPSGRPSWPPSSQDSSPRRTVNPRASSPAGRRLRLAGRRVSQHSFNTEPNTRVAAIRFAVVARTDQRNRRAGLSTRALPATRGFP